MKLPLAALCLFVTIKCIASASVKIFTEDELYQSLLEEHTFYKFKKVMEIAIEQNYTRFLNNIPSLFNLTSQERLCYSLKCVRSSWCNTSVVPLELNDAQCIIPSIAYADNPAVLELLSPKLRGIVLDPVKLATYDAVNLAKELDDPTVFVTMNINLYELHALRIIGFLKERGTVLECRPSLAITMGDVWYLASLIKKGLWEPSMEDVETAIKNNADHGLLLLLKVLKPLPSPFSLYRLIHNSRFDVLECIRSYSLDWKASQAEIDAAARSGYVQVLQFYFLLNPKVSQPSKDALKQACESGYMSVLEWFLVTYHPDLQSFKPGWIVNRELVRIAEKNGLLSVLKWHALANPRSHRPSQSVPSTILGNEQSNVFEGYVLVNPNWKVSQEQADAACRACDCALLKRYASVDPTMSPPSEDALLAALDCGNLAVFDWVLKRHYRKHFDRFQPSWALSQENVNDAAQCGYARILQWSALVNPKTLLPSNAALNAAVRQGFLGVLDCCILIDSDWTPSQEIVDYAMQHNDRDLFKWFAMARVKVPRPSKAGLRRALTGGHLEALKWYATFNPDWQPSQEEVDVAAKEGHVHILDWYSTVTPEMPQPSDNALYAAIERGHSKSFEWFLMRYYNGKLDSFAPTWRLDQENINLAARTGCVFVLEWDATINPDGPRPNIDALWVAHCAHHRETSRWYLQRYRSDPHDDIVAYLLTDMQHLVI